MGSALRKIDILNMKQQEKLNSLCGFTNLISLLVEKSSKGPKKYF